MTAGSDDTETEGGTLPGATATYDPADNKLRLRAPDRLDEALYARVRAAGFIWAPKQKLFVAPMWTPDRADLLVELCGEIGDEDTSLVDRAEERAERFEEYSDKRADDANAAHAAVSALADGIPLGQPILVGHHSEKRARKDAERIKSGMRKAVRMWETSKYWEQRAKGAMRHAKYKELPGVRHRRIKGLEADRRKQEREIENAEKFTRLWQKPELTREQAMQIANFDRVYLPKDPDLPYGETLWGALDKEKITVQQAIERALVVHAASIVYHRRWLDHVNNRLAYERAMLGEQGGPVADKFPIEVGGRILAPRNWRSRGKGWLVVTRVNRGVEGAIGSVSTTEGPIDIEDVTEYKAPDPEDVEKVKKAKKLPPIVNYPGEGFRHMTKADYDRKAKHTDLCPIRRMKATDKAGAHRLRHAPREGGEYWDLVGVYITDAKRVDLPAPESAPEPVEFEHQPGPPPLTELRPRSEPARTVFDDMKDSLKAGVIAVAAPQLFPTPPELAARMVREARVEAGMCVLEPSAGTGNIVRAVLDAVDTEVLAYEIDSKLCQQLARLFPSYKLQVRCCNFLEVTDFLGCYPRILMNPPFADGQDVAHVTHAYGFLAPGGVLKSVMSAGVRFRQDKKTEAFRALVEECGGSIEDLPDDTFKSSGTSVRTVLVTLYKE